MSSGLGQHQGLGDPALDRFILVAPPQKLEALARLLGADTSAAEQFVRYADENGICLDALWASATPAGRIAATVLAVPSPGRTAMIFATHPVAAGEIPRIGALLDRACGELSGLNVHLAQALLEPIENEEHGAFRAGEFTKLADLAYLERTLSRRSAAERVEWPGDVTIEPYHEAERAAWIAALDASYEDTLDCAALRGLRDTGDVLTGHQSTGRFEPGLWSLLRIADEPAGTLMLSAVPRQRTVELAYLGLAPHARGKGLGTLLLRHGIQQVSARRERALTLAVDERNEPALRLYRAHGFRRVLRRAAFIRPISV